MPFTKTFGTTAGAYSTETLWEKISVRSAAYAWTASGSGTNEYYVRTAGGANPGFSASPTTNLVFLNGVAAAKATLGSLTAGQFGFGDNDTLGYSTLYVRLADGADPDSKVDGWVKFQQSPQATEHVRFTADSASINSATGLDQSAVAIGDFIVEKGYSGTIGSQTLGYLIIDPDYFEFEGSNECWINLFSAAISPRVLGTGSATPGNHGLYLLGTALSVVDIRAGNVGIAANPGETATATTVRIMDGDPTVVLGSGLSLTNLHLWGGDDIRVRCATTAHIQYAGNVTTEGTGTHAAVTLYGGEYVNNSSGTITAVTHRGGTLDELQSGVSRTITTYTYHQGASIRRNKESVTHTTDDCNESMAIAFSTL